MRKELSEIVEADVRGESEVLNLIQSSRKSGWTGLRRR